MIKTSSKQTGSAHVIIIVILVVALIGMLGFVFWRNLQGKPQIASTAITPTKKVSTTPKYLDLPYWSIRLQIPDGLDLTTVSYYKTHIGESPEYYGFTTNRVKAQGGQCDNEAVGNLAILNRSTSKDGEGTLINNDSIGGYYYYLDDTDGGTTPSPHCLTTDIAVQDHALLDKLVRNLSSYKVDTTIHGVDIKMQSSTDIKQLPSYVPISFTSYMQQLLAKDTISQGMFDCGSAVVQYQISKISQVNIEGGTVPVNEKGETCPGGAPVIWILTPAGSWDQETRNGTVCESKNGGFIYAEFAPECYSNANSFIENPNGSITSLNK